MSCKNIEELLSRYVEDDVSRDERIAIDEHVAACSSCAASLALYQQLESSLLARRELLPVSGAMADAVIGRVGIKRKKPWWSMGLRTIPMPAVLSTALIAVGVVLFMFRDAVATWISGAVPHEGSAAGLGRFLETLGDGVVAFAGANQIVIMTLYFGVFGLIFFTGSVMVLRFVRE